MQFLSDKWNGDGDSNDDHNVYVDYDYENDGDDDEDDDNVREDELYNWKVKSHKRLYLTLFDTEIVKGVQLIHEEHHSLSTQITQILW